MAVQTWTGLRYKIVGIPITKAPSQPEGSDDLFVRGYFTSDRPDERGDIITRGATERAIPKYKQWSNIRRMHLPDPVAKVVRIGEADGLAWNEVELKVIDPKAKFEVENGLLQALSVGILIKFEDIEFNDETGGLIINDYLLAEISLVDHPANYDAALDRVKSVLGTIASQGGQEAALKSLDEIRAELASAKLEKSMAEENAAVETQSEGEVQEAPVAEQEVEKAVEPQEPVAEEAPAPVEEPAPAEEPASEEQAEEAQAEEEAPAPEEEAPAPEAEEPVEAPAPVFSESALKVVNDLAVEFRSLAAVVAELRNEVKALAEAKAVQGEPAAEAAQPVSEVEPEPVEEEKDLVPADRKGAVPETEMPELESQEPEPVQELRPSLKKALAAHFGLDIK